MRRGVVLPGSPAALVPGIHTHYKRPIILRALLQRAFHRHHQPLPRCAKTFGCLSTPRVDEKAGRFDGSSHAQPR
jgi:hypothetical protein